MNSRLQKIGRVKEVNISKMDAEKTKKIMVAIIVSGMISNRKLSKQEIEVLCDQAIMAADHIEENL